MLTTEQFVNVVNNLAACFYPKPGEVNPYAVHRVLVGCGVEVDPAGPRVFIALTTPQAAAQSGGD